MNWINIFGIIIVVLMLIPNLFYAYKFKGVENKCKNKAMNLIEQAGRYGSMFLMAFNIGLFEFGFSSSEAFVLWIILSAVLLIVYWIIWCIYFKKPELVAAMALAIIPSAIFIFSGVLLRHYVLLIFALLFCVGHVYVSYVNNKR